MKKLSRSTKKFICRQKAQIRRQFWDIQKRKVLIEELYKKFNNIK